MKKDFKKITIQEKKEIFVNSLVTTNRGFNFYIDWNNVFIYKEFEIEIQAMNVLIGITDEKDFEKKFFDLVSKLPNVVKVIPLLFALSKKERENIWKGKGKLEILEDEDIDKGTLEYGFSILNKDKNTETKKYFDLFIKMGLKNLFQNLLEKSVLDYIVGVLAGLDSNGRKNRGGKAFELAVEPVIRRICEKYGVEVYTQKKFKFLEEQFDFKINDNMQIERRILF